LNPFDFEGLVKYFFLPWLRKIKSGPLVSVQKYKFKTIGSNPGGYTDKWNQESSFGSSFPNKSF
jgi:hypothetical protein